MVKVSYGCRGNLRHNDWVTKTSKRLIVSCSCSDTNKWPMNGNCLVGNVVTQMCCLIFLFFKLGFTPWKAEMPLQGIELQEKEAQND